jgi:hypothetical protein
LTATAATTSAAAGSSHQSPKSALPSKPTKTAEARYAQSRFWVPSPLVATELSLSARPALGDPEEWHPDDARGDERDPEPARLGLLARPKLVGSLEGDVRGEQEELDRDQLLRPFFGAPSAAKTLEPSSVSCLARNSLDGSSVSTTSTASPVIAHEASTGSLALQMSFRDENIPRLGAKRNPCKPACHPCR